MTTASNPSSDTLQLFEAEKAIWFFDYAGDPRAPHAQLTGGLCSDGYMKCSLVLSNPSNAKFLARKLVETAVGLDMRQPDWVVGSAYGAITFSYEVARLMGARHGFVKKLPRESRRPQKFVWEDLVIPDGAKVLQCEDLISTLGTTSQVRLAIMQGNESRPIFLPKILAIVYRPEGFDEMVDGQVIALLKRGVQTWSPPVCPLCSQGSEPVRSWAKLTGR